MLYKDLVPKIEKELEKLPSLAEMASDSELIKDKEKYRKVLQEYTQLQELHHVHELYLKSEQELEQARDIQKQNDNEMKDLIEEEIESLEKNNEELVTKIQELVTPINPLDHKGVIMEIRAGTGGDEAALFVADLFRMYSRFSEINKWKLEIIDNSPTAIGGYKEIVFSVGKPSYGILKHESGVHRVQRIPTTESGGRIHTSAVTVAVFPDVEKSEIVIKTEDIRVDVFRSSGPGGQSVNTTDSAVRITHIPTKIVVSCQDEKSQHKNKDKAMRILRARITAYEEEKKQSKMDKERKQQVGSGDRSERIRTYNFPQNRLTDHRINLTLYQLDRIIEGDVQDLFSKLKIEMQQEL